MRPPPFPASAGDRYVSRMMSRMMISSVPRPMYISLLLPGPFMGQGTGTRRAREANGSDAWALLGSNQ